MKTKTRSSGRRLPRELRICAPLSLLATLFLGSLALPARAGDCPANTLCERTIELAQGLNFVSLPLVAPTLTRVHEIVAELEAQNGPGFLEEFCYYDESSGYSCYAQPWRDFGPTVRREVRPGDAFWLKVSRPGSLRVRGFLPRTIQLELPWGYRTFGIPFEGYTAESLLERLNRQISGSSTDWPVQIWCLLPQDNPPECDQYNGPIESGKGYILRTSGYWSVTVPSSPAPSPFRLQVDAPQVVEVAPGQEATFEATVHLSVAGGAGADGWSLGVSTGLRELGSVDTPIVGATTAGTVAAGTSDRPPGLRKGGFESTALVGAGTREGIGAVSIVVLGFKTPIALAPREEPYPVLRLTLKAKGGDAERLSRIYLRDGLTASEGSLPVLNVVSERGLSRVPELVGATVAIRPPETGVLSVDPPELVLALPQAGCGPRKLPIGVENRGGGALSWQIASDIPFVAFAPANGAAPSVVTASMDTSRLAAGTHKGTITVSSPEATNSPLRVPVTIDVLSNAVLAGCAVPLAQGASHPVVVTDGAGGAIIVWADAGAWDGTGTTPLYAQHYDAAGDVNWRVPLGGRVVQYGNQYYDLAASSDGAGGAIITWRTGGANPPFEVRAQRIDRQGKVHWGAAGVLLGREAWYPRPVADGQSGAFVFWNHRSGMNPDSFVIRAQRVHVSGAALWADGGMALPGTESTGGFGYKDAITDGAGGALIAWNRTQAGGSRSDVYAQRITAAGSILWGTGAPICRAAGDQFGPLLVSDGEGGAIIAWNDDRSFTGQWDIFAQRVDGSGRTLWAEDGINVTPGPGNLEWPSAVSDGTGGAIIAWMRQDLPLVRGDIYAQRVDKEGLLRWGVEGLAIAWGDTHQVDPAMIEDGKGGAFLAWSHRRWIDDYTSPVPSHDIFAQWLDSDGGARWGSGGIPIYQNLGSQSAPTLFLTGEGRDELLVLWDDFTNPLAGCCAPDLLAQRVRFPGEGGLQQPGDCNQDGKLDISDPRCLLDYLFLGTRPRLPCGDGTTQDMANIALLDSNGDGKIDLSDPVYSLGFLFLGGPPPRSCGLGGSDPACPCLRIAGCPEFCSS
ncbi:MAG: hypothetical protein HY721_33365 [Planctomycetes bacterium]|nr:hypothetical protein [Planctomycetota bacterium]